ncbi:DegV family protein [Rothia nasimurium]|uniref:DegV family protein n=1 Tax=Rothia nasimurium TaxID=85336 RepID=UPI00162A78BF|nr:DegV family protein [Rothia nasimurium]
MRSIALVTDSSAALPAATLEQLKAEGGFSLVELPVTVGDRALNDLPTDQIDAAIALAHVQGEQVLTSGVAPGTLVDAYEHLAAQGYTAIISVHLSGELSGTCDAARLAAQLVDVPVVVVDSLNLAMGLGEPVLRLHRLLAREQDLEQATAVAEELCASVELFFFIPTLDALKRGGRVSPALAMVGQMFQIRPVATVLDGKLHYVERPRTTSKAIERLAALTEQASSERAGELPLDVPLKDREAANLLRRQGQVVAIHYSGNEEQAREFQKTLGSIASGAVLTPLPPVLSAHAGLGALAAVIF